jgi:hypothetical protein
MSSNFDSLDSFSTTMDIPEIDQFRKNIIENISNLNLKKARLRPYDFRILMNYHQYILDTLNNMINVKHAEYDNPYNLNLNNAGKNRYTLNPFMGEKRVIYNKDGTTRIVTGSDLARENKEEWESQFDESLLMNPPSYILPPSNVYDIGKIKNIKYQERLEKPYPRY